MFGLISQLRRAGVLITSNIAEGFSRPSFKEKCKFYYIALGSLNEVQNQLLISRDLNYISVERFCDLSNKTIELSKIINGLIRSTKERIS